MEDAHTTELSLDDGGNAFFAVYDGHGGQSIARFSGSELHLRIKAEPSYQDKNYTEAIKKGFLNLDAELRRNPEFENDPSGCTAVTALVTAENTILVGNAGDSRAVISCNGENVAMSHDHKPANIQEHERIRNAGGFVEFGRVNGNLALSRAIGDFEFKNNKELGPEDQIVTANPDIVERSLTSNDEFLVIACDGIWDCMTNQEVVDYVSGLIAEGERDLKKICEQLMDNCLASDSELGGVGCDNMTVIIVCFLLDQKSESEWFDQIAARWLRDNPRKVEDLPEGEGQNEEGQATSDNNALEKDADMDSSSEDQESSTTSS